MSDGLVYTKEVDELNEVAAPYKIRGDESFCLRAWVRTDVAVAHAFGVSRAHAERMRRAGAVEFKDGEEWHRAETRIPWWNGQEELVVRMGREYRKMLMPRE